MKKFSFVIVLLAVIALTAVGACGGNGDTQEPTTTQPTQTTTQTTTQQPTTTQPSGNGGGSLTWNDMPVYGGSNQIQKGSWSIPADEGDYSKVEWRYYETGDDIEDVVSFYKDKMPDNGWEEVGWFDMQEVAWGMFMKNAEKDAAYVWMTKDNGDTIIAMMRATE